MPKMRIMIIIVINMFLWSCDDYHYETPGDFRWSGNPRPDLRGSHVWAWDGICCCKVWRLVCLFCFLFLWWFCLFICCSIAFVFRSSLHFQSWYSWKNSWHGLYFILFVCSFNQFYQRNNGLGIRLLVCLICKIIVDPPQVFLAWVTQPLPLTASSPPSTTWSSRNLCR